MAAASYTNITLFRRLLSQAQPHWLQITSVFLLDFLATPLTLLHPLPLKIAVDSVIGSDPLPRFFDILVPESAAGSTFRLLLLVAVMQVLIILVTRLRDLCGYVLNTSASEMLTLDFRARLFRHAQRLSLSLHDSRGTADSIYRIQYDAPAIQWLVLDGILTVVSSSLMLIGMIYVIALINWELALVALAVSPFVFTLGYAYDRWMHDRYHGVKKLESHALKVVHEVLTAVRVVKAFGREDQEQGRFVRHTREGVRARVRLAFAEGAIIVAVGLATAVGTAMVLYIGIRNVQSGLLSIGELLMVITYLSQLYGPLETISNQFANAQSSLASARRAFELLDEPPEVAERPNARPLKRAAGGIEFHKVSFGYEQINLVLQEVSFAICSGTRLGIAGATGAGKTTLVSLLARFYDPTSGQILLDGIDLRDYKLADLRNQLAIVLQEPVLFSTSIAENIAYARLGADGQEIVDAARAANAHEFIVGLPESYETLVGERGMRLSGGERQRIALARAFLKDAPILILDEPTSSVDIGTETVIMEAMERLMKGKTTFMIAHRLSTLERCDVLLVIENGQVTAVRSDVSTTIKEALAVSRSKRINRGDKARA